MMRLKDWQPWLVKVFLGLWGLQVIWLMWYFGPDLAEVATKVGRAQVGATARQDDPFYRWATAAAAVIPEDATYIFVDDY